MNNQQIIDPSLASVQSVLSEEKPNKREKLSTVEKEKHIITIIICVLFIAFGLWLYSKWMTIPTVRHLVQVEHLSTHDSTLKAKANITIYDNRGYSLINNIEADTLKQIYRISRMGKNTTSLHIKLKDRYAPSLPEFFSQRIFDKVLDTCQKYHLNINDFSELIIIRHFDNNKSTSHNDSIYGINKIVIHEINGFDKEHYPYSPFEGDSTIDKQTLQKYNLRNSHESFYLLQKKDELFSSIPITENYSKPLGLLRKSLSLEDITQSYYELEIMSHMDMEVSLKLNFVGAITCIHGNDYDDDFMTLDDFKTLITGKTRGTQNSLKVGLNSITFKSNGYRSDVKCLVKYNDMENIQTMRLFILAALITLTLTTMIKAIIKLLTPWLTSKWQSFKAKLFKSKRRKRSKKEDTFANSSTTEDSISTV